VGWSDSVSTPKLERSKFSLSDSESTSDGDGGCCEVGDEERDCGGNEAVGVGEGGTLDNGLRTDSKITCQIAWSTIERIE
jgi:hypothetical protein